MLNQLLESEATTHASSRRAEYLRYGLAKSLQLGIWGGTSGRTRRKIASMNKCPRTRQALEDAPPMD